MTNTRKRPLTALSALLFAVLAALSLGLVSPSAAQAGPGDPHLFKNTCQGAVGGSILVDITSGTRVAQGCGVNRGDVSAFIPRAGEHIRIGKNGQTGTVCYNYNGNVGYFLNADSYGYRVASC